MLLGVLIAAVIVTIYLFWRVRPLAAWLMAPYLAWILFASLLNYEFLAANPDADGREGAPPTQRFEL